jgi:hypothetical protein
MEGTGWNGMKFFWEGRLSPVRVRSRDSSSPPLCENNNTPRLWWGACRSGVLAEVERAPKCVPHTVHRHNSREQTYHSIRATFPSVNTSSFPHYHYYHHTPAPLLLSPFLSFPHSGLTDSPLQLCHHPHSFFRGF